MSDTHNVSTARLFRIILLFIFALLLVAHFAYKNAPARHQVSPNCEVRTVDRTVRGSSVTGIYENGEEVSVLMNYYACEELQKGDVVIYKLPDESEIIKIVKAVPGDAWSLEEKEDGYALIVNEEELITSTGAPYRINEGQSKLLSLYVRDYDGIIPEDALLLLGNTPNGSKDSTSFGLAAKNRVIGKVAGE